jgi:hypothetical protein
MPEVTEPLKIEEGTILTIPEGAILFYMDGMIDPADLAQAGLDIDKCVPVIGNPSEIIGVVEREDA